MSEGFCKTLMLCNVGADPEIRMTQGGTAVLNLRVAVNTSYLDKDKQRKERVDWFTVVCFGKRAEALGRTITKGSTLFIEAEPRARSYDDRDGNKRTVIEFHMLDVKFCGGGEGRGGQRRSAPAEEQAPRGNRPAGNRAPEPPADDFDQGGYGGDDDIPFIFIGQPAEPEDRVPRSWL